MKGMREAASIVVDMDAKLDEVERWCNAVQDSRDASSVSSFREVKRLRKARRNAESERNGGSFVKQAQCWTSWTSWTSWRVELIVVTELYTWCCSRSGGRIHEQLSWRSGGSWSAWNINLNYILANLLEI